MNENLDLVEKLKNCPKGTKLWSPLFGEVVLHSIDPDLECPIMVRARNFDNIDCERNFTRKGVYFQMFSNAKCLLFPSEDQQDWDKFVAPIEKFDYSMLKPFDKILVRDDNHQCWKCCLFSYMDSKLMFADTGWYQGIPYNDETKHLIGTNDMPDGKYVWWK